MRQIVLTACATLATLMAAPSARACRVFTSPEQRISAAYARHSELRVAVVRVIEARHLETWTVREMGRLHSDYEAPWRTAARVTKLIVGAESPELLVFDRNHGSAACDDGTTMPKAGDQWVVYYVSDHPIGAANVLES